MKLRILFVGEDWHGSNATSFKRALRFLGCDVLNIDEWDYYPQWRSNALKIMRLLLRPIIVNELSNDILKIANFFLPQVLFVYKGVMVNKKVLIKLGKLGIQRFLFYPDPDLFSHYRQFGNEFDSCLPHYDCVFSPKTYHLEYFRKAGIKRVEFLPYAYDQWCHYPVVPTVEEVEILSSDVAFIGSWKKECSDTLENLVSDNFPYNLAIWGPHWDNLPSNSMLRKFVTNQFVVGETQAKIFSSTKIALAFLLRPDLHTARTFEIPAYKAFMLAERTSEHTTFFREGEEIECFSDVRELRGKIDYYLKNEDKRNAIALAGHKKVTTGGHSYVDRMRQVLNVYQEMNHGSRNIL